MIKISRVIRRRTGKTGRGLYFLFWMNNYVNFVPWQFARVREQKKNIYRIFFLFKFSFCNSLTLNSNKLLFQDYPTNNLLKQRFPKNRMWNQLIALKISQVFHFFIISSLSSVFFLFSFLINFNQLAENQNRKIKFWIRFHFAEFSKWSLVSKEKSEDHRWSSDFYFSWN